MVNKFFKDKTYKKLFEDSENLILRKFMRDEKKILSSIKDSKEKTFVDLGAGHGRITPFLSKISKRVFSIEINSKMIPMLIKRSSDLKNSEVIKGNILNLDKLLSDKKIEKPVLLLLQNTLSVLDEGDSKELIKKMRNFSKKKKGEIIISLALAESLPKWGLELYSSTSKMTGEPDLDKIDFKKGLFVSKTGYVSKWYSSKEIEKIKEALGGRIVEELITKNYYILHINYN